MNLVRILRGWSGALLAAFLTLAILVPMVDAFVCIADVGTPASETVSKDAMVAATKDVPETPLQSHDDGDSSCIHGHCHHWVGVAKFGERLVLNVSLNDVELSRDLYGPPPSAPQIQLLRPPRA